MPTAAPTPSATAVVPNPISVPSTSLPPPPLPPSPSPPPTRGPGSLFADAFLEAITGINIDRLAERILVHAARRRIDRRGTCAATRPSTAAGSGLWPGGGKAMEMALVPSSGRKKRHFVDAGGPGTFVDVGGGVPPRFYPAQVDYLSAVCSLVGGRLDAYASRLGAIVPA